MEYKNKKIAVIGLAVSNTPLIRYLADVGARLSVFDRKPAALLEKYLRQLQHLPLELHLGDDYLQHLHGYDYVFITPGMKKDLPELQAARAEGTIFSSEMALFFAKCPGRITGITGSSGKTTTTTLVGQMVAAAFPNSFVGGNIGRSLIGDLYRMDAASQVILELSSFQLQELKQSPSLAVVTNITPNHLDMHASMAEYIDAKSNILRYQSATDQAILNYDNELTRGLRSLVKGRCFFFSRHCRVDEGAYLEDGKLLLRLNGQTELITKRDNLQLLGDHNVENVLTAALAARLLGAPLPVIAEITEHFTGVEHRLQFVRELNGVRYYNDSIATTPDRAIAGLKAMIRPTVLIAGGYDKKLPFDSLGRQIVKTCKQVVLLGVTAPLIRQAVEAAEPGFPVTTVADLPEAVRVATDRAVGGDVVLLSPACASFDMFNNYQERGLLFKELVNSL
ncbi:MAG: UDP-N-acetylmuramoyl-L-alanine--D-glutamate ligase [Bacillota bacterium]|jgi:UDP-N-acetylmuramoylalanine--D-glutamate ligase